MVPSTDKLKTTHISTPTHKCTYIHTHMYMDLFIPNEMRKIRAKKKGDYRARNMQCVSCCFFLYFSSVVIISVDTSGI